MFRELNEKVLKQLIYNIEIALLHVKGKVVKIFRRKDVCNICVRHLSIDEIKYYGSTCNRCEDVITKWGKDKL